MQRQPSHRSEGRRSIGWCLAAFAASTSIASAQGSDNASGQGGKAIEEVIVTAQRRAERLEDVPAAIQAIDGEALKSAQITRFQDLQLIAPSVQAGRTGILNQPAIRGVTTTFAGGGQEANVAVYVDGFYNADQLSINQDFANIESVEILKGPQGALYGRNATGGAILIKTRSPTDQFEADVTLGYAPRFDNRKMEAFVGGPLTDALKFSVAGYWRTDDGYVKDINRFAPNAPIRPDNTRPRSGNHSAEFENWSIRPKLQIELGENTQLTLGYVHAYLADARSVAYRVEDHIPGSPTSYNGYPLATEKDTTSLNFKPINKTEIDEFQFTGEFGLAALGTLTARSAYRKQDDYSYYDLDATPRDPASGPGSLNGGGNNDRKTYVGQLDFASELEGPFNFLAGLFYYDDKYEGNNFFDTGAAQPITNLDYKTEAWAAYLDGTYNVGNFYVTLGGRYSEDRKSVHSITQLPNGFVIASSGSAAYTTDPDGVISRKSTDFSPRAVVRYNLSAGTNVYASISRGFKSGTVSSTAPYNYLKPEKVMAYEVGFKTSRGALRSDVSAFYYDFKDSQVAVLDPSLPNVTSLLQNSGGSEIYGIDGTISYQFDRLTLRAGLAYLHSRYTDFDNATNTVVDPVTNLNTSVIGSWSGRRTIRSPDWSGTLAGNYALPLAGGTLDIGTTVTFSSRYPVSNASYDCVYALQGGINQCVPGTDNKARGRFEENGYALANAQVAWTNASERYTLTVYSTNITNTRYKIASVGLAAGDYISHNEPRVVGASIRFRY